jgi:hypothetical protein
MKQSPENLEIVLQRIAEGMSLRRACQGDGMPAAPNVCKLVRDDPEFARRYHEARLLGYQLMADELVDIADDTSKDHKTNPETGRKVIDKEAVMRSRLKVDTRKWLLSKTLPKVYGDRQALELSGPDGKPLAVGLLGVIQRLPQSEIQRIAALPADEAKAELLRLSSGEPGGSPDA